MKPRIMTPRTAYRAKLGLAAGLAFGTIASSLGLALAMSAPDLSIPWASDLVLASEARADAALRGGSVGRASAAAESRAALAQAPLTAAAWLRLAYLETEPSGGLGPRAMDMVERSYAVAPFGPEVSAWRLRFLYEHWRELTPSLRSQASAELRTLARYRPGSAHDVLRSIESPTGRLAADMTVRLGAAAAIRDRTEEDAAKPSSVAARP